jgi:FkbM family methyltransferase
LSWFSQTAGLLRSLAVYYGHPFRHVRLKRLYEAFVRPGDVVFDAGAHAGNHTRAFLALGASVVAVEPQPVFCRFLRRVFGKRREVTVIEAALGAFPGRAQMSVSSRTPTVSTLDREWQDRVSLAAGFRGVRWDRSIDVDVTTLDRLIEDHGRPTLIKIDVEGSEPAVLRGLSQSVPAVCFEALPDAPETVVECIDRLASLGFDRFNWTTGERAVLQPDWVDIRAVREMAAGLPPGTRERNIFARCDGT